MAIESPAARPHPKEVLGNGIILATMESNGWVGISLPILFQCTSRLHAAFI
jgi:hypothetical protein